MYSYVELIGQVLIANGLSTMGYLLGSRLQTGLSVGKYAGYMCAQELYIPWHLTDDSNLKFPIFDMQVPGYKKDQIMGIVIQRVQSQHSSTPLPPKDLVLNSVEKAHLEEIAVGNSNPDAVAILAIPWTTKFICFQLRLRQTKRSIPARDVRHLKMRFCLGATAEIKRNVFCLGISEGMHLFRLGLGKWGGRGGERLQITGLPPGRNDCT